MRIILLPTLALLLLAVPLASAQDGGATTAPADPDAAIAISWKDTRDATVAANLEVWQKELATQVPDETFRKHRLAVRTLRLLRALDERFPPGAGAAIADRVESCRRLADACLALQQIGEACACWKKLMDDSPGNAQIAREALAAIISAANTGFTADDYRWVDYAWERIVALDRCGLLADDKGLEAAFQTMYASFLRRGMFGEVWNLLRDYETRFGRTAWWADASGAAIAQSGQPKQAVAFLKQNAPPRALDQPDPAAQYEGWILPTASTPVSDTAAEMKWESAGPHWTAEDYADVIRDDAAAKAVLPSDSGILRACWLTVDEKLTRTRPPFLPQLRQIEERRAAAEAADALRDEDWPSVVELYRRFPWAPSVHRALAAYAEAALVDGRSGEALRTFRDLHSHSDDQSIRAQAAAGMLITAAASHGVGALDAALKDVPPDLSLPFAGRQLSPKELADELRGRTERKHGSEQVPPPAGVRQIRMPAAPLWNADAWYDAIPLRDRLSLPFVPTRVTVQSAGGIILAAGPLGLACYRTAAPDAAAPAEPAWVRTSPVTDDASSAWPSPIPGEFTPCIADGRICTRWQLDRSRQCPLAIACIDAATGALIWSTDGSATLADKLPVNDPVAAEGGVYFLAASRSTTTSAEVSLIRLDGRDGTLVWRRPICAASIEIPIGVGGWGWWRNDNRQFTFLPWCCPVAVRDGSVYFQTDLGVVGKCDARDGMPSWLRTYARTSINGRLNHVLQRMGGAPCFVGDRVVFAPRDYVGAFAVNADSGKLSWDAPLLPSDRILGTCGSLVILSDATRLVGVDAASGAIAWTRPLDSSGQPPRMHGSIIYAAVEPARTGDAAPSAGIVRISAADGTAIAGGQLKLDSPTLAFTVSESAVASVVEGTAGIDQPAGYPVPDPAATGNCTLLWRVRRPGVRMLAPDDSAVPGRVLLYADGAIECVPIAEGVSGWRALVPPNFLGPYWGPNTIALFYPGRLLLLDADTGRVRREFELPFAPGVPYGGTEPMCAANGRYLAFAGSYWLGIVDMQTGSLRHWLLGNYYGELMPFLTIREIKWIDGRLVLTLIRQSHVTWRMVVEPADGRIELIETRPGYYVWEVSPARGTGYFLQTLTNSSSSVKPPFTLNRYSLASPAASASLMQFDQANIQMRLMDDWLEVRQVDNDEHRSWFLRHDDPNARLEIRAFGDPQSSQAIIRGNRLCEIAGATLIITDLVSRKEIARCPIPAAFDTAQYVRIVDFRDDAGGIRVLSESRYNDSRFPSLLRIHTFDPQGTCTAEEELPPMPQARIVRLGSTILVQSGDSVFAFARAKEGAAPPLPQPIYRAPGGIVIDGGITDWRDVQPVKVPPQYAGADFRLAHDAGRICILLSHPEERPQPKQERGLNAAGNWIEVRLPGNEWIAAGTGARGVATIERSDRATDGARAAIKYDLSTKTIRYEVALPIEPRSWTSLLVRAWHTGAHGSPEAAFQWGFDGSSLRPFIGAAAESPPSMHNILLHPFSPQQEAAALQIADQFPDLKEPWDCFRDNALRCAGTDPRALARFLTGWIRKHPHSAAVPDALLLLDQQLRRYWHDPVPGLLALAREAGVPEETRRWYAAVAGTYISQWVKVDPANLPREIAISAGGSRTAWWTSEKRQYGCTGPQAGLIETTDRWQELRAPLILLGMHASPIQQVTFTVNGGGQVLWGKTTLKTADREIPLLAGKLPEGATTDSQWDWLDAPAEFGGRAHTGKPPFRDDRARQRWIKLAQAVTGHIIPAVSQPKALDLPAARAVAERAAVLPWNSPLLQRVDALLADDRPARIALREKNLRANPADPAAATLLNEIIRLRREAGEEDPGPAIKPLFDLCSPWLSQASRFSIRRDCLKPPAGRFIRTWQVLGPLPADSKPAESPDSPEKIGVQLARVYPGQKGDAHWKLLRFPVDTIPLLEAFPGVEKGWAYAACWIRSEQPLVICLRSDEELAGWINRQPLSGPQYRSNEWMITLKPGWNELLLRTLQTAGDWQFKVELVDCEGLDPPAGAETRAVAPDIERP